MENGIADAADYLRLYYLVSHIYQVYGALGGVGVRGYLHWFLSDNYGWAFVFRVRFGLLFVDCFTKRQYWRSSVYVYREVALSESIPDGLMHLSAILPVGSFRRS
jgi:beta-galactosidase